MPFQNLDQIRKEFDLISDDPKEMRKKLRRLMAKWHPDKHGGENSMPKEIRDKFLKANEADQFIEKYVSEQRAIVPANEVTELIKLVRDLVLEDKKTDTVASFESRLSEQIEQDISQVRRQYLAPRITVSAIATALTTIWLLPETISKHPVLRSFFIIEGGLFALEWMGSILLMIFTLYGTSISEEREKRFQSELKTETFQNKVFETYIRKYGESFTKSEFINFLIFEYLGTSKLSTRFPFNLLYQIIGRAPLVINPEAAQIIADLVFERAERRGVIRKDEKAKRIEEVYTSAEEDQA